LSRVVAVTKTTLSQPSGIGEPRDLERFRRLLAFSTVERWLRKKAPGTRYEYLTRYSRIEDRIRDLTGAESPDQFVAWAKARDGTEVQDVIETITDNQSQPSQNNVTACLRSILRKNGYNNLPKMDSMPGQLEYHRGYKREEIQGLLSYLGKPIEKLYVFFAKDSGLRAQDLLSLAYRHVKQDLEAGQEYVHLELEPVYYQRKKAAGITFIGPNTIRLLNQLINNGTVAAEQDAKIFPFKYSTLHEALTLAKTKANLDRKLQPSHGLRKFFENSLDRVGMDHNKKLQLEGHSQGVRVHYTDRSVEELRKLYQQAYQFLDLSEEALVDSRIVQLEKDNQKLREELDIYKQRIPEIERKLERFEKEFAGKAKS
jgi:hypothetical protein